MSINSNSSNTKLCILAAGLGTRNTTIAGLHKAMLPVDNKPAISFIIESVPKDVSIVVAVGHMSKQIISYLEIVHKDRDITFVHVDNYKGVNSGPGLSLLHCKEYLKCPFIFTSVDTIIEQKLDMNFKNNWLGVCDISDKKHNYCLVKTDLSNQVKNFFYNSDSNGKAFIGIAGIKEYEKFWNSLEKTGNKNCEHQVIDGLNGLIGDLNAISMRWLDTGNNFEYEVTKKQLPNDLVIEKNNEVLYAVNGKIVKYFSSEDKNNSRILRSKELKRSTPDVLKINENMFCYDYIPGMMLSDVHDEKILKKFLEDYQKIFRSKSRIKDNSFIEDCKLMYEFKTYKRIKSFINTDIDKISYINGLKVPSILDLLEKVNWEKIYNKAIPSDFHGDMQPENIIVDKENNFVYIDWRESFGKSTKCGDAYYDLGKLYHAIIISNSLIKDAKYDVKIKGDRAVISYELKSNLKEMEDYLFNFCKKYKYDGIHVMLVGTLNYLNIACLYENYQGGKYGKFLFLLGKYMITKILERGEKYEY